MRGTVAFLFLGETLLIPHLYPIVEALCRYDVAIDLWVATSEHEALLSRWTTQMSGPRPRIRRAPGFRRIVAAGSGRNPALPAKLPMLFRLAPRLSRAAVVVCAEQTSLWLPQLLPMRARFVKTSHGVGSMSARDDPRRRAAARMLVPSERERATYLARGFDPGAVVATGYVKADFRQRSVAKPQFPRNRPTLLYAPHWQEHRSSWFRWGEAIVRAIVGADRWNLIFAPHQRLPERASDVRRVIESLAGNPHVLCDLDSFAMVDGSYTSAADIYLGDTSSQVVEFLIRPRPCVFLNALGADWNGNPDYAQWACGEVVGRLSELLPALDRAPLSHWRFAATQAVFARESLGAPEGAAARAAAEIAALL